MKIDRLRHEPAALVDFYREAMERLGALCERTWYDRLQVVAEGPAARLWNPNGTLHEVELHFPAPDSVAPRDAEHEVFPGCPLTFQLSETLRPQPVALERVVLTAESDPKPPDDAVADKLWRSQHPDTTQWRLKGQFAAANHFSLLVLVRCEIQAIDQHWSLRRLAISLPDGAQDDALTTGFSFARPAPVDVPIPWPALDAARCHDLLTAALAKEMAEDVAAIRVRQEKYLRRELDRVDDYFENYERELGERSARSRNENTKRKAAQRLAAARAEHQRRRADQLQRHEIRVLPHLDALLLVAEPAWRADVVTTHHHETRTGSALFIPRSRRWVCDPR